MTSQGSATSIPTLCFPFLTNRRNTQPFLSQCYSRDTGETMHAMAVPITLDGRHWGAFVVGYSAQ